MKIFLKKTRESQGYILFHSVFINKGRIRKGKIINANDIKLMSASGIEELYVGSMEKGEIDENSASRIIGQAILSDNFSMSPTFSGKTNITSKYDGLFEIKENNVRKLNEISSNIAISSLNNHDIVYRGDHVLSVKSISYAIKYSDVNNIVSFLSNENLINLKEFKPLKFGIIYSHSINEKNTLIAKTKKSIETRIRDYNSSIMFECTTNHDFNSLKESIKKLSLMDLDVVLLFLSSSVSDYNDIVPQIIIQLGGKITSFGMPVDPGNLTLSATLGKTNLIAAAGSARSDALNGLDWHLNCLHAGVVVNEKMVNSLGVGGLLKDIDFAIKRKKISKTIMTKKANIAAVVLSAGQSKRMGEKNKLLLKVNGKSIIKNYIDNITKSNISEVIVVTGHESEDIMLELKNYNLKFVFNEKYKDGLSTSLRAGIKSLGKKIDAVMICLPDMPLIGIYEINKLIEFYNPSIGNEICIATSNQQRGNPVLWDKSYFNELMNIKGDKGGRDLLSNFLDKSVEVDLGEAVAFDIDTNGSYALVKSNIET